MKRRIFLPTRAPFHDDVIKWKHFPRCWPFVRGIHRSSPVNSPHKGQWRGALMFSLICALNKRLSKQPWSWWFETPTRSLWRHCNVICDVGRVVEVRLSCCLVSLSSDSNTGWQKRLVWTSQSAVGGYTIKRAFASQRPLQTADSELPKTSD